MSIYEININDEESYEPYLFNHEHKSAIDFTEDIGILINQAVDILLATSQRTIYIDDIIKIVIEKLPELGYTPIKPKFTLSIYNQRNLNSEKKVFIREEIFEIFDNNSIDKICKFNDIFLEKKKKERETLNKFSNKKE